jgi:hypothetical protein
MEVEKKCTQLPIGQEYGAQPAASEARLLRWSKPG